MTTTDAWDLPARTLAEFVARTNRLPRQSGADNDVEKKAGTILRRFRSALTAGTINPDLRSWLDENVIGWTTGGARPSAHGMRGRRSFEGQAKATATFRKRHGHLPSAAGRKHRERELGTWLRNNRQAAKGKGTVAWTTSKRLMLDRIVPGWEYPISAVASASSVLEHSAYSGRTQVRIAVGV